MVLVDTSIWIDHFRKVSGNLSSLLEAEEVTIHSYVLGELACGNLSNRKEIIALLHALPHATKVEEDEILLFIERHRLMGRGIGLIDAHILASCCIDSCLLWTRDKRLQIMAKEMNIEYSQQLRQRDS
ncbi:MAG: PIN domain-containing protein [Lentisphaerae bacterium]|nr:PIN domain-containing protein [Lentisphaerota bacterium]